MNEQEGMQLPTPNILFLFSSVALFGFDIVGCGVYMYKMWKIIKTKVRKKRSHVNRSEVWETQISSWCIITYNYSVYD